MEQEVIADIARRVKKTGRYTETAELMAKSMVEQGYSAAKIQADVMKFLRADKEYQKAVAENTKAYKQEIQDIIDETVKAAKEAGNKLVEEAGSMAWNNDLSMWEEHGVDLTEPNDMIQLLEAFKKQTNGQLKNITKTTGFRNTVLGTTGVMQAYQREMDLATLKVATGTFSYDEAVNECVKRLAQSGLRSIDYANGRTYQLDTAARMCVRTGMSQLSGKITEMNLKNTGQDLVRTSQHMGSRPEHAPWQNKVFSYSGTSKKYPDFFLETGYGTVEGLKGANCTHDFYPYWEGDYIPPDVEPNEEYYNNTQKQRAMERGIRATKREIEAQKAIGGDTTELRAKLKKQTADYYVFSEKVGIRAKDNRLVVMSGTSNLNKKSKVVPQRNIVDVVGNIKKEIDFTKESKKINEEIDYLFNRKSKWSGKIIVTKDLRGTGQKEWNCDISLTPNAKYADELHELIHARSISYETEAIYMQFYNIEEGSVELLTEEICKSKGISFIPTYEEQVKHLRRINRRAKLYTKDFDFAVDLINEEVPNRIEWLISKINISYSNGNILDKELEGIWDSFKYLIEEYNEC